MFDGNEPSRGESIPNRPGGAKPIGTFGVIEDDRGGTGKWVLCAGTSHRSGAYHDGLLRLKSLCAKLTGALG